MQVRDALLDPLTVERLKAVRQFVEKDDGEFPTEPLASDISGPIYGQVRGIRVCREAPPLSPPRRKKCLHFSTFPGTFPSSFQPCAIIART